MNFDDGCADSGGRFYLAKVGIDEQTDGDACGRKFAAHIGHPRLLTGHRQSALGGKFFPPLRHQTRVMWRQRAREVDDRIVGCHFEIQFRRDSGVNAADVFLLDVAPVLATVNGDAFGTAAFGGERGLERVRVGSTARLAKRGDMIDIYTKTNSRHASSARYAQALLNRGRDCLRMTLDGIGILALNHDAGQCLGS